MKKLVLVVAMFMFVCGGSFLAKAQSSQPEVKAIVAVNDTVVNDTVKTETPAEPVKEEVPAEPVKE